MAASTQTTDRRERMIPASILAHPSSTHPGSPGGASRTPLIPPVPVGPLSREEANRFSPGHEDRAESSFLRDLPHAESEPSFLTSDVLKDSRINALWRELKDWRCTDAPAKVREIEQLVLGSAEADLLPNGEGMDKGPIASLLFATTCLRFLGIALTASTIALIVGMVLSVVKQVTGMDNVTLLRVPWTPDVMVTWGLLNLGIAVVHEAVTRHGLILFDSIREELGYRLDFDEGSGAQFGRSKDRPAIGVRIVLRKFSRYAELPMVPGKFGSVVFALFNVIVPVGVWVCIYALAHHRIGF